MDTFDKTVDEASFPVMEMSCNRHGFNRFIFISQVIKKKSFRIYRLGNFFYNCLIDTFFNFRIFSKGAFI